MKDALPPYEELEVKLTAYLLGELGEEEVREVEAWLVSDEKSKTLYQELKASVELMREAASVGLSASAVDSQAPTRLSEDRRQQLLDSFRPVLSENVASQGKVTRGIPWYVPMGMAAALAALLTVSSVMLNTKSIMGRAVDTVERNSVRDRSATAQITELFSNAMVPWEEADEAESRPKLKVEDASGNTAAELDFASPFKDMESSNDVIDPDTPSRVVTLALRTLSEDAARKPVSDSFDSGLDQLASTKKPASRRTSSSSQDFGRNAQTDTLQADAQDQNLPVNSYFFKRPSDLSLSTRYASEDVAPLPTSEPMTTVQSGFDVAFSNGFARFGEVPDTGGAPTTPKRTQGLASRGLSLPPQLETQSALDGIVSGVSESESRNKQWYFSNSNGRDERLLAEMETLERRPSSTFETMPQEVAAFQVKRESLIQESLDSLDDKVATPADHYAGNSFPLGKGIELVNEAAPSNMNFGLPSQPGLPAIVAGDDLPQPEARAASQMMSGRSDKPVQTVESLEQMVELGDTDSERSGLSREGRERVVAQGRDEFRRMDRVEASSGETNLATYDDNVTLAYEGLRGEGLANAEGYESSIQGGMGGFGGGGGAGGVHLGFGVTPSSGAVTGASVAMPSGVADAFVPSPGVAGNDGLASNWGAASDGTDLYESKLSEERLSTQSRSNFQAGTAFKELNAKSGMTEALQAAGASNGAALGLALQEAESATANPDASRLRGRFRVASDKEMDRDALSLGESLVPSQDHRLPMRGDHASRNQPESLELGKAVTGPVASPMDAKAKDATLALGRRLQVGLEKAVKEESKQLPQVKKSASEQSGEVDAYAILPMEPITEPPPVALEQTRKKVLSERLKEIVPAEQVEHRPEVSAMEEATSTFSLNVSDVSFKLAQAALEQGQLPDPASIRSEQFLNAFDYRDPAPYSGQQIGFHWEAARHPFAHHRDVLRFALKTASSGRTAGRPLSLTLLLDNSGSMERSDRREILRQAIDVLSQTLGKQDKISVVSFARTARLWVDGVPGGEPGSVLAPVKNLVPQGGTNLEEALNVAYDVAQHHFLENGVNRVILLTDGAANLGNVDPDTLKQKVERERRRGVAFDCFGVGWDGLNDPLLESLSRNGDGRYAFLNDPSVAGHEFAERLAGALHVAASDVKVQVEFNPDRVGNWRQVGYAKHQLTKEQFRDNTVDAAEIAAAEAGNALYVIEPKEDGAGPIGVVRVRYREPHTHQYHEKEWTVPYRSAIPDADGSSPSMKLALASSLFAEWMNGNPHAGNISLGDLKGLLRGVPEVYGQDPRPNALERMLEQASQISGF